jgi:hypothetical protein
MAQQADNREISELVREAESNFISGGGTIMSKYVTTDLFDDINKIYAYLNSKHTTGDVDSMGREKPFFNICLSARNIYYRATDIDRKDITITPTKAEDVTLAFVATVHLQNWMRETNFGAFLNDWGLDLSAFNSSVVKFVEKEGELHAMVVPWSRLIVDQINFNKNPKIEILEVTEAELYNREGYDKEQVERLCDALQARQLADGTTQDRKSNYVKLYEVHGYLPLSYITGKLKDEHTYVQQMHVLSFVESKNKGQYDEFTLVSGREEKDPYMLTSLLPATDGSISLDGAVKNLFDAQWMVNHSVKSIKDQLDVASKLVFQTADANFVGRNVLTAIEQGDILIHSLNMPLTQVNNGSHDITSQQMFSDMWKGLASEINGVSESMMGKVAPSGTAWRQVEAILQESHSLFELMTENKGLYIEDMLRTYVIPFLKKKMNSKKEIVATLESHDIARIDGKYIKSRTAKEVNEEIKKRMFESLENDTEMPTQQDVQALQQGSEEQIKGELADLGNQRFFRPSEVAEKTWAEVLDGLEWRLEVNVTNESSDKQTILTTLNTTLATIANPNFMNNPTAQLVVSKILTATGVISPIELAQIPQSQAQVAPPPALTA